MSLWGGRPGGPAGCAGRGMARMGSSRKGSRRRRSTAWGLRRRCWWRKTAPGRAGGRGGWWSGCCTVSWLSGRGWGGERRRRCGRPRAAAAVSGRSIPPTGAGPGGEGGARKPHAPGVHARPLPATCPLRLMSDDVEEVIARREGRGALRRASGAGFLDNMSRSWRTRNVVNLWLTGSGWRRGAGFVTGLLVSAPPDKLIGSSWRGKPWREVSRWGIFSDPGLDAWLRTEPAWWGRRPPGGTARTGRACGGVSRGRGAAPAGGPGGPVRGAQRAESEVDARLMILRPNG